jgi:hypothetical protein
VECAVVHAALTTRAAHVGTIAYGESRVGAGSTWQMQWFLRRGGCASGCLAIPIQHGAAVNGKLACEGAACCILPRALQGLHFAVVPACMAGLELWALGSAEGFGQHSAAGVNCRT